MKIGFILRIALVASMSIGVPTAVAEPPESPIKPPASTASANPRTSAPDPIDRIAAIGGAYYLPYRPHARLDQMATVYSGAADFAATKRTIDPQLILRNNLWDSYLERL